MPTPQDYRMEIRRRFAEAQRTQQRVVEIHARKLYRDLGGTIVNGRHTVGNCCQVMLEFQTEGDEVALGGPPPGDVTRLIIRYRIPRP